MRAILKGDVDKNTTMTSGYGVIRMVSLSLTAFFVARYDLGQFTNYSVNLAKISTNRQTS